MFWTTFVHFQSDRSGNYLRSLDIISIVKFFVLLFLCFIVAANFLVK